MCKVIVFAGTTEGREIAEFLDRRQIPGHICVATEYGEQLLPESPVLEISHQRLDLEEMKVLFQEKDPDIVVDATHPLRTAWKKRWNFFPIQKEIFWLPPEARKRLSIPNWKTIRKEFFSGSFLCLR